MAWVTLFDLMDREDNMNHLISWQAPCIVRVGCLRESEFGHEVSALPYVDEKTRSELEAMDGLRMTVIEFAVLHRDFATDIEWFITSRGTLINMTPELHVTRDGSLAFLVILELDISEWLRAQDTATLSMICTAGFSWNRDRIESDKFSDAFIKEVQKTKNIILFNH